VIRIEVVVIDVLCLRPELFVALTAAVTSCGLGNGSGAVPKEIPGVVEQLSAVQLPVLGQGLFGLGPVVHPSKSNVFIG
jgi:hypothetical protein